LPNYRLTLEYDGTDFQGWQLQAQPSRTVQGCLAAAFEAICGGRARVRGAGRTDSGVHAEGQVATCSVETRLDDAELLRALNATLPTDVAVIALARVGDDFDPRRAATSKSYRYVIWNHPIRSPLRARRSLWVRHALDVDAMRTAAAAFVGTHDFASFQAAGSDVIGTVRTLTRVSITGAVGGEITLSFEGSGFLRYMVRNLTGTLLEIGRGHRPAADVPAILAARDRARAGRTAPAHGLTFVSVRYGESPPVD
jgi:tRNA pseudouridine38-40 synthase